MKANRIISALRKCKVALELHQFVDTRYRSCYVESSTYRDTQSAIEQADAVLDDWQAEKLKKSEAFQ